MQLGGVHNAKARMDIYRFTALKLDAVPELREFVKVSCKRATNAKSSWADDCPVYQRRYQAVTCWQTNGLWASPSDADKVRLGEHCLEAVRGLASDAVNAGRACEPRSPPLVQVAATDPRRPPR